MSMDIRPHAYDPDLNPELFEGVLSRRVMAFLIDFVVISVPVVLAAMFIFVFGIRHIRPWLGPLLAALSGLGGLGFGLFRADARRPAFGYHRHAGHGSGNAHLVRRAGLFRARRGARHRVLDHGVVLTPFVLLVAFFNRRKRLLHDILLGTVIINNAERAAALRPFVAPQNRHQAHRPGRAGYARRIGPFDGGQDAAQC